MIGQGFIRLMKMLVVPLVFCSLVCGSMAIGDTKKLGTVGSQYIDFLPRNNSSCCYSCIISW